MGCVCKPQVLSSSLCSASQLVTRSQGRGNPATLSLEVDPQVVASVVSSRVCGGCLTLLSLSLAEEPQGDASAHVHPL